MLLLSCSYLLPLSHCIKRETNINVSYFKSNNDLKMRYVFTIVLNFITTNSFHTCSVHLPGANQECIEYCNLRDCQSSYCTMNFCEWTKCERSVNLFE